MAGTNGDARRVLDACRYVFSPPFLPPSRLLSFSALVGRKLTLTNRRAVEVTLESTSPHSVTPKEMMAVLNLMSSSPVAMFVKNCSTQQKVMLASVVRCVRREGIAEIPWRNVSPSLL
jgi:origin recognition complex subunit 1